MGRRLDRQSPVVVLPGLKNPDQDGGQQKESDQDAGDGGWEGGGLLTQTTHYLVRKIRPQNRVRWAVQLPQKMIHVSLFHFSQNTDREESDKTFPASLKPSTRGREVGVLAPTHAIGPGQPPLLPGASWFFRLVQSQTKS